MSKRIIWAVLIIIAISISGYVISKVAFIYYFGHNYMDDKSPKYLDYVAQRINFGTKPTNTTFEADTIFARIDNFFKINQNYNVPDSLNLHAQSCIGCAQKEVLIYFSKEPIEIYKITFDPAGFNYIDEVYYLNGDQYTVTQTTTLDNKEKARIVNRLKTEMLNKIDWSFKDHNN